MATAKKVRPVCVLCGLHRPYRGHGSWCYYCCIPYRCTLCQTLHADLPPYSQCPECAAFDKFQEDFWHLMPKKRPPERVREALVMHYAARADQGLPLFANYPLDLPDASLHSPADLPGGRGISSKAQGRAS